MTTIITANNRIYADRHHIVNHSLVGMVGAEQSSKITTTDFCHYATTGFVPDRATRDIIEMDLATIFTLLGIINPKGALQKSFLGPLLRSVPGFGDKLEYAINVMVDRLKFIVHKADCKLLAIDSRYTLIETSNNPTYTSDTDCQVIGASSMMASILLHHKEPIANVYDCLCSSNTPTGAVYDECLGSDFITDKLPPLVHPRFLANIIFNLNLFNNSRDKNNPDDTEEDMIRLAKDIISLVSMLGSIGSYNHKTNRIKFNKKLSKENLIAAGQLDSVSYQQYAAFYEGAK